MVSTSHPNASELFARDLGGLVKFFAMKMRYVPPPEDLCKLEDIVVPAANIRIDEEVRASGFSKDDDDILMRFIHSAPKEEGDLDRDGGEDDDEDDDEEAEEEEEEEEFIKKKKPSKRSTSRVTDFLNSSSSSAPINATEDRDADNVEISSFADGQEEAVSASVCEEGAVPSSPMPLSRDGALNSNQWIPEPGDLDRDRTLLEGEDGDLFSEDDKGSVAILTEEALQRVKDKTRK